jgi:hypothetical protein
VAGFCSGLCSEFDDRDSDMLGVDGKTDQDGRPAAVTVPVKMDLYSYT